MKEPIVLVEDQERPLIWIDPPNERPGVSGGLLRILALLLLIELAVVAFLLGWIRL